jgi:NADH-quinone oxidoreductase subunit J
MLRPDSDRRSRPHKADRRCFTTTDGHAPLHELINPVLLYVFLAVGAIGVALALPRRGVSPQIIGGLVAGVGFGAVLVALGVTGIQNEDFPGVYFYVFAPISLGSALRVITHPRPVYAAIYFVLTILSSSAMYLLMQAEFMAFALIIIYAGAILITYLFVIMLATQAPSEENVESLTGYDSTAREPLSATLAGFALLAVLTGMIARGTPELQQAPIDAQAVEADMLEIMPKKVLREFEQAAVFDQGIQEPTVEDIKAGFDTEARSMLLQVVDNEAFDRAISDEHKVIAMFSGRVGDQVRVTLPPERGISNAEGVGFTLIAGHPMALELAGVILLMAMLGAVVLARKQIELGEDEKLAQQRTLGQSMSDVVHVGGGQ